MLGGSIKQSKLARQRTMLTPRSSFQSHNAPASLSCGIKAPLMCAAITRSKPPSSFPPTKTAGTAWESPTSFLNARSNSAPPFMSSNSYTVGPTPRLQNRRFTTWHIQQELKLNTTTAFSAANLSTLSTASNWLIPCIDHRLSPMLNPNDCV
ncbi:hypothetical protein Mapa_012631 [Marchantia paleacea]|nr:hypothetical protein Mapa_012631 [Marchantia paleacea]